MSIAAVNYKSSAPAIPGVDPNNIVELDPGSAEFKADAHRHMAEWARRPPFYAVAPGQMPQVIVGRYADARQVFSDTATFASEMPRGPGWEQFNKAMDAQFVTQMDGEQHARVRRLLMPAFSSRRIAQLEEALGTVVGRLLDAIEAKGPDFDAMNDYGAHLVVDALLEAMIDMDERRKAVFVAFHDLIPGTTYVKPGETWAPELRQAFDRAMEEIKLIIEERRVSPRSDFISDLVNARDQGDKLSDRELFDQIFGICGASLSATSRAAGGALYLLYTHDDQRRELIANPDLVPSALEECLRLGSNGYRTFPRIATKDTEVGGTRIPKGTVVRPLTALAELRPRSVSRSAALRHSSQAAAHHVVRRRPAPLHRQYPRALDARHCAEAAFDTVSPMPASAIRISSRSTAAPSANCGWKACRCGRAGIVPSTIHPAARHSARHR